MPTNPVSKQCVSVIFNPASGKEAPEKRRRVISESLADHGYECQFLATTEEQGAKELAKQALKDGVDLIVVSGGDGTVMEVLSVVAGTNVPVAVLPAGTGNLLSANLGIPSKVPEAIEVALSGKPQKIDLAKTGDGRYFAIMGGIGMDAHLIHDADRESKNRLGVFAYFKSAWQNRGQRQIMLDIYLDDQPPLHRKVKTLLVANMGKITGGLQAVPTADPTSGRLEVSIITVSTFGHWLRLLWYAVRGKTDADPKVEVHRVNRVRVRCEREELIQFDGEDGGRIQEVEIEAIPAAVALLIPK